VLRVGTPSQTLKNPLSGDGGSQNFTVPNHETNVFILIRYANWTLVAITETKKKLRKEKKTHTLGQKANRKSPGQNGNKRFDRVTRTRPTSWPGPFSPAIFRLIRCGNKHKPISQHLKLCKSSAICTKFLPLTGFFCGISVFFSS